MDRWGGEMRDRDGQRHRIRKREIDKGGGWSEKQKGGMGKGWMDGGMEG